MPKNTQMHMQWITVNGQSVPLVLPQYWDGEKWVISSEQNPLPVKAELTGSNVEYVLLEHVILTAGSEVYTGPNNFKGSRLGINTRFDRAIKHRVRAYLQSTIANRGVGGLITVINLEQNANSQSHGTFEMTTTRYNIGITNVDTIDAEINLITVVDFI